MKRFVFGIMLGLMAILVLPAQAQTTLPEYRRAETDYDSLSPDIRSEIQVLLTAAGYLFMLPGDTFSPRVFEGIKAFQAAAGMKADGRITETLAERLFAASRVQFARWRFVETRLPGRPTSIWVPTGFGLKAEITENRIQLRDAQGQMYVSIDSFKKGSLKAVYDLTLKELKRTKSKIKFANRQAVVAMITYEDGNYNGHWQYHTDKYGVVGFNIRWNGSNSALAGDRVFLLIGGSLVAAIDRIAFPEPPSLENAPKDRSNSASGANPSDKKSPADQRAESESASSGTGFFVSPEGHLLTNAHVVDKCRQFLVTPPGTDAMAAKLLAVDVANDLALLKISAAPSAVATIRPSIQLGEQVAIFGYPLSSVLSRNGNFTLGNITALAGLGDDSNRLQISAPVQPGNSGGPMIDQHGNLVGVVVSKLNAVKMAEAVGDVPQNVNFAIKASVAINFMTSNGVGYTEASSPADTPALTPVLLAEKAKAISAFILCK